MVRKAGTWVLCGLAIGFVLFDAVYGNALVRYIEFAIDSGDWLNDWLTHLPEFIRVVVRAVIA